MDTFGEIEICIAEKEQILGHIVKRGIRSARKAAELAVTACDAKAEAISMLVEASEAALSTHCNIHVLHSLESLSAVVEDEVPAVEIAVVAAVPFASPRNSALSCVDAQLSHSFVGVIDTSGSSIDGVSIGGRGLEWFAPADSAIAAAHNIVSIVPKAVDGGLFVLSEWSACVVVLDEATGDVIHTGQCELRQVVGRQIDVQYSMPVVTGLEKATLIVRRSRLGKATECCRVDIWRGFELPPVSGPGVVAHLNWCQIGSTYTAPMHYNHSMSVSSGTYAFVVSRDSQHCVIVDSCAHIAHFFQLSADGTSFSKIAAYEDVQGASQVCIASAATVLIAGVNCGRLVTSGGVFVHEVTFSGQLVRSFKAGVALNNDDFIADSPRISSLSCDGLTIVLRLGGVAGCVATHMWDYAWGSYVEISTPINTDQCQLLLDPCAHRSLIQLGYYSGFSTGRNRLSDRISVSLHGVCQSGVIPGKIVRTGQAWLSSLLAEIVGCDPTDGTHVQSASFVLTGDGGVLCCLDTSVRNCATCVQLRRKTPPVGDEHGPVRTTFSVGDVFRSALMFNSVAVAGGKLFAIAVKEVPMGMGVELWPSLFVCEGISEGVVAGDGHDTV